MGGDNEVVGGSELSLLASGQAKHSVPLQADIIKIVFNFYSEGKLSPGRRAEDSNSHMHLSKPKHCSF